MVNRYLLVVLLSSQLVWPARAYDPERARQNLSYDLVECATYYQMSAVSATKMNRLEVASEFLKSKDFALKMLATFRPEPGAVPKLQADMELASKEFARRINNEGWSRVILVYSDMCRDLLKDPEARLNYWLQKQD